MAPGSSGQLTFDVLSDGITSPITGAAEFIAGDDTPIDWNSFKPDLQPALVPDDAWDAVFDNFTTIVGGTEEQYRAALDADATYLSQLGESTGDVQRLISLILKQADDFGAVTQRYS